MAIEQFLGGGLLSALGGAVLGAITYKQATRVAHTQALAQVSVKQLEGASTVQNLWHDDLKAAQSQLQTTTATLIETIKACATAQAQNQALAERNEELDACIVALKKDVAELTQTKQQQQDDLRYYNWLKTNPAELRRLADEVEQRNKP